MVDSSAQCYYLDASRTQQGPASVSDLARLVRSGAITRDTMVWFAGMPDWRPASQIPELASLFGPAGGPPPMRPPMPPAGAAPGAMRAPAQNPAFGGYDPHAGGSWIPPKPVGFGGAIATCFRKYVGFSGRAARSEYWWWFLFYFIVLVVSAILDGVLFGTPQALFYFLSVLALLLPTLAVGVRRLHDTNRSGWMILLGLIPLVGSIILIVFFCQRGTDGPNQYDEVTGA